jgi:hypothetical protein
LEGDWAGMADPNGGDVGEGGLTHMNDQHQLKLIHEGGYLAEIEVEMLAAESEWAPYLSVEDATKLDLVRRALREGDVSTATKYGSVFSLIPVAD